MSRILSFRTAPKNNYWLNLTTGMFGLLPRPCRHVQDAEVFGASFCSLGKYLHSNYGVSSKLLVNRDSTFLSLIGISQNVSPIMSKETTCCNPLIKKQIFDENNIFVKYAAAVTLQGLEIKIKDEIEDDNRNWYKTTVKAAEKLLQNKFKKAEIFLLGNDFSVEKVKWQLGTQALREKEYEKDREIPISYVSEPSALSYAEILAFTSQLSYCSENHANLYEIGYQLGHIVYLIDAVQDYFIDIKKNEFNPLFKLIDVKQDQINDNIQFVQIIQSIIIPEIQKRIELIQFHGRQLKIQHYQKLIHSIIGNLFVKKLNRDIKNSSNYLYSVEPKIYVAEELPKEINKKKEKEENENNENKEKKEKGNNKSNNSCCGNFVGDCCGIFACESAVQCCSGCVSCEAFSCEICACSGCCSCEACACDCC